MGMVRTSGRSRSEASRLNEAFWRYFTEQQDGEEPEDDEAPPEDDEAPPEDEDPPPEDDETDADMEPMQDAPTLPRDIRQDATQPPAPAPDDQRTASQSIRARYTKGEQDYFLNKDRTRAGVGGAGRVPDFRYGPPSVSVVVR